MSDDEADSDVLRPRETGVLFGHDEAERALLDAYKGGRIPHAWLIGGPPGIGKATLAYRLARFVLAHPDPQAPAVQKAASLAVDADHPVARRIAAQAQGDLLVLERVINEQDRQALHRDSRRRRPAQRCRSSARPRARAAGASPSSIPWTNLQRDGANTLLKVLEEPPPRTLLLLVSNAPGRELPTIRSRCRRLLLRPLDGRRRGARASRPRPAAAPTMRRCGCGGRRRRQRGARAQPARRSGAGAAPARARTVRAVARSRSARAACARRRARRQRAGNARRLHGHGQWLAVGAAGRRRAPARQLARTAEVWEKVNRAAREVETYNLERKPLVFAVFGLLAEAARA